MAATIDENNRPAAGAFNPERFGRLESDVEYIKRDVAELKDQVKELRAEITGEFKSVRAEARADFRWLIGLLLGLIGLMLAGFGGILSAVAEGFHGVG